jgi:hypothetical protein
MKFEIHFEFRASLRKFQDLNFWDATLTLYLPMICFAPSLSGSFIFLTLTRLVVVLKFINFRFTLFTPPLGDFQLISELGASLELNRSK